MQVIQVTEKLREAEEAVKLAQEKTLSASQESTAELESRKQNLKEREEQVCSLGLLFAMNHMRSMGCYFQQNIRIKQSYGFMTLEIATGSSFARRC